MLAKFISSCRGNFTITAALAVIPMFGAAALGLDYSRISRLHSDLQIATDSAALAAAEEGTGNVEKAKKAAQQMFTANIREYDYLQPEIKDIKVSDEDVEITAGATIDLVFGAFVGRPYMDVAAEAHVTLQSDEKYEVVLVLDNTYSMKGKKISDLQEATETLVDLLDAKASADIKMGIVPFSRYVNVGLGNRNQPWIYVPDESSTTKNVCYNKRDVISKTNCRTETRKRVRDGITEYYEKNICDYKYGDPYQVCRDQTRREKWYGCVGSRNYPYNVQSDYGDQKIPGLLNIKCGREIMPLTSNLGNVGRELTRMKVNDETYLPGGFIWGRRLLDSDMPYTQAQPVANDVKKIMIVMTDGETTASPSYPYHTGKDTVRSDELMMEICQAAKIDDGIRIITVKAVDKLQNIKSSGNSDNFLKCASSPEDAFLVDDTGKLTAVFEEIAKKIAPIRLAM
ncbi:MAG: pilus assembly protein TadG-related protein [Rhizobiaceae bacterium]